VDTHVEGRPADAGQVVPLVAALIVVMAGIALAVVAVGGVLADRAVARTAADAAALVAAVDSDEAAAAVAGANGARLVAIERHGVQVEVTVAVGRVTARARAEALDRVRSTGAHGAG